MTPKPSPLTEELQELEKQHLLEGLQEDQIFHFCQLTSEIHHPVGDIPLNRRKSFRLPVRFRAIFEKDDFRFEAVVEQVSYMGFKARSESFCYFGVGDQLLLKTLQVEGEEFPVDLTCRIVRVEEISGEMASSAGIEVTMDSPEMTRREYFDRIYYPAYRRYLETEAQAKTSRAQKKKPKRTQTTHQKKPKVSQKEKPANRKPAEKPSRRKIKPAQKTKKIKKSPKSKPRRSKKR